MYRYLALLWNPADERSRHMVRSMAESLQAGQEQWSCAVEAAGIAIYHAGRQAGASDACLLPHSSGAVLGKIFTRDIDTPEAAARVSFDEAESSRIVASGGRRLLERYWGRYVAIVRNAVTDEVWILRDPSGGFPCWYTSHVGIGIVCSDIEDCRTLPIPPFTVNWSYITGLVAHAGLQVRDTALNEVSEVQAGERLRFSGGSVQRAMEWNPVEIAHTSPLELADEAVVSLRETTVGCVHAWASCYDGIVHNLSGGLDSSIVLSCLKSAPSRPRVTCLNYFTTGPNEDERRYARLMAQRAGVDLVERELLPGTARFEQLLKLRCSPRPWFYMYELEHGSFEGELAAQSAATGLFTGAGGDSVFYQARADLAVTDYLFARGLDAGLLGTAIDAARVSRKSIWSLLWQAFRTRIFRPEWDPISMAKPLTRTIVASDVVEVAKRNKGFTHPWLTPEATREVAPGILWHITSLSMPPAYYSSFFRSDYPERAFPLLSQPLVELCLRIPTYLLIRSGRDRALARRAFADDLPVEIVRRFAKGRADQHFRNVLDANLPFVRELLLDGVLVQKGLLNRVALEQYLTRERSPADYQYNEILQEHVCTEAWLRSWPTSSCAAASSAHARRD
jgi:asparagine synthase (glutamine-hydrolysing)